MKLDPFNGAGAAGAGPGGAPGEAGGPRPIAAFTKAVEYGSGEWHGAPGPGGCVWCASRTELARAIQEYEAFLKLASSAKEAKRVKKALPLLKKRA